jgi:hypothetical protein
MMRRCFEFTCDNCCRVLLVRVGGTVSNLATAKRNARENGWWLRNRELCERCNPQGDYAD